jgi:hypothetical protein
MSRYEEQLFEYFSLFQRQIQALPLLLGGAPGSGGGIGGRPGGFLGFLPQTRVSYDMSEAESLNTPISGQSILDNLNHIRYRISALETSPLDVYDEGSLVKSGITILNFVGNTVTASDGGGNQVNVTISGILQQTIFTIDGDVSVNTGNLRIYNNFGVTRNITKVFLSVSNPPTSQDLIIDVNKGGTTVFTTQANRPVIAGGANTGFTTTIDIPTWGTGEYLTVDVDQVGSGNPGANLTIHVVHS